MRMVLIIVMRVSAMRWQQCQGFARTEGAFVGGKGGGGAEAVELALHFPGPVTAFQSTR